MNNNKYIVPSELENSTLRKDIFKVFYNIMKEVAGISNHNLVRNSNAYVSRRKHWPRISIFLDW